MAKKLILFGIKSDAETIGRLFEEFKKRGAETRDERNKIMLEFFARKENRSKVQDVIAGEEEFSQIIKKHKTILSGEVEDGKSSWKVYKRKDKEGEG